MVLGSLLIGYIIIYMTFAAHSNGEYLHLDNEFVKVDFPRNWFAYSWKTENSTSGSVYGIVFASPQSLSAILFKIHDKQATQYYMKKFNLTDASSIVTFETERMCNWTVTKNENASVILREKGEVEVSGNQASYSKVIIKNGIESNGAYYNMSFLMMSYIKDQRLVQIVIWGKKEDCEQLSDLFEMVLNSTDIKV